jgi:hypothetical protein
MIPHQHRFSKSRLPRRLLLPWLHVYRHHFHDLLRRAELHQLAAQGAPRIGHLMRHSRKWQLVLSASISTNVRAAHRVVGSNGDGRKAIDPGDRGSVFLHR